MWYVYLCYIDGLGQESRNSIANALKLGLFALIYRYIVSFVYPSVNIIIL